MLSGLSFPLIKQFYGNKATPKIRLSSQICKEKFRQRKGEAKKGRVIERKQEMEEEENENESAEVIKQKCNTHKKCNENCKRLLRFSLVPFRFNALATKVCK